MTPEQRTLRARLGGLTRAARYDGRKVTDKARRTFLDRFTDEARKLAPDASEAEIERRANALLLAHMTKLALASSRSRRRP